MTTEAVTVANAANGCKNATSTITGSEGTSRIRPCLSIAVADRGQCAVRMLGGVAVAGAQAKTPATVRGQR